MTRYTSAEVCQLLGWPPSRLYGYVRDGLVHPVREGRAFQFTFSDLIVLRAANQMLAARVPARRVRRALKLLARRLEDRRPLSTVRLAAVGNRVAMREGDLLWDLESGQAQLDFDAPCGAATPVRPDLSAGGADGAADLYNQAVEIEDEDPEAAARLYRDAIAIDDGHADVHINLGRLLQQAGDLEGALTHYERALALEPDNPLTHFNLGTLMEDRDQQVSAERHYLRATDLPDAHLNLARLYASWGDTQKAIRHLRTVRFWRRPES